MKSQIFKDEVYGKLSSDLSKQIVQNEFQSGEYDIETYITYRGKEYVAYALITVDIYVKYYQGDYQTEPSTDKEVVDVVISTVDVYEEETDRHVLHQVEVNPILIDIQI